MAVKLNSKYIASFLPEGALESIKPEVEAAHNALNKITIRKNLQKSKKRLKKSATIQRFLL